MSDANMTKELLKAKVIDIQKMSASELFEFGIEVSVSLLDAHSKEYMYRAIENRQLELEDVKSFGYLVDEGDTKPEEFKL
jgi:hypothetical protein